MLTLTDMLGQKYGQLTVIAEAGQDKWGKSQFLCECVCGTTTTVTGNSLRTGHKRSCGCLSVVMRAQELTRHGQSRKDAETPEHLAWSQMRGRCRNVNNPRYKDYGGRGITICERWEAFENFFADMGPRPSPKHSIDRINNDGNYEPLNCRWATTLQQAHNQRIRSTNKSGVQGVSWHRQVGKWCAHISGVPRGENHLGLFDNIEDAARAYAAARAERDCNY